MTKDSFGKILERITKDSFDIFIKNLRYFFNSFNEIQFTYCNI